MKSAQRRAALRAVEASALALIPKILFFRQVSRFWLAGRKWSEWQDLNLRPLRPERSALPD
jgi:hypothetical protein